MPSDLRVAAALSLMASACISTPQIGDEPPRYSCGTDPSGWLISEAPPNADDYRRLAAENPNFKTERVPVDDWGFHEEETWLINSSGQVILCLADGPPWEAWTTSFWEFTAPDVDSGQLEIASQAATIVVG